MADLSSTFGFQARKPTMAELLMKQSIDTSPTPSWGAAIARALQGGLAGYYDKQDNKDSTGEFRDMYGPGSGGAPQGAPTAPQTALLGRFNDMSGPAPDAPPRPSPAPPDMGPAPSVRQGRAMPGTPNARVADAFGDAQAAINSGTFDPQGSNNLPPPPKYDRTAMASALQGQPGPQSGPPMSPPPQAGPMPPPAAPLPPLAGQGITNPQMAQANPMSLAPPQPGPAAPTMPQGGGGAPQQQPGQQQRQAPQIPPDVYARAERLWSRGTPEAHQAAHELMKPYMTPKDQVRPMSDQERAQWKVPEGMSAGINSATGQPVFSPPQTNIALNTAQKGQEVMATEGAKDYQTAQNTGREATKRSGTWDAMEQAAKGFTPGATAEVRLQTKRYLRDLGFIQGDDVPDQEVFAMLQKQLAIHAQPQGQGSVSNYERSMYASSIAGMNMSPEGLSRAIQIGKNLDGFDRKVAQIWRDNARTHGGVPDSISANEEIDKLGSPLSTSDMNFLRKSPTAPGNETGGAGAGQPAPTQGGNSAKVETATNPTTGQKIVKKNGQWVPMQ